MQLLDAGVGVRRIARARRQTHEHADLVRLLVRREQLAGESRRHVFPFGFDPHVLRGQLRFRAGFFGDAACQTRLAAFNPPNSLGI